MSKRRINTRAEDRSVMFQTICSPSSAAVISRVIDWSSLMTAAPALLLPAAVSPQIQVYADAAEPMEQDTPPSPARRHVQA